MVKVFFLVGVEDAAHGVVGEVSHDVTYLWGAECVFCLSLELWFLHVEGNDGDESCGDVGAFDFLVTVFERVFEEFFVVIEGFAYLFGE